MVAIIRTNERHGISSDEILKLRLANYPKPVDAKEVCERSLPRCGEAPLLLTALRNATGWAAIRRYPMQANRQTVEALRAWLAENGFG